MRLTNRQQLFIEEYLRCWNGSEAVRRAGFKGKPNVTAARLLANISIQEQIKARLSEKAMSADEVLTRLAEHARGDMGNFLDIGSMGFTVDLDKAKELGLTHLIKKVDLRTETSVSKDGIETETHNMKIELYDAQAALVQIGRHHGLFIDKTDITTGGEKLSVPDERYDRAVLTLADALRKVVPGAVDNPEGALDAPEQPTVASPSE